MGYEKLKNDTVDGIRRKNKKCATSKDFSHNIKNAAAEQWNVCWQHIKKYKRISGSSNPKAEDIYQTIQSVKRKEHHISDDSVTRIQIELQKSKQILSSNGYPKTIIHRVKKLLKKKSNRNTDADLYVEVYQEPPKITSLDSELINYLSKGDKMQDIRLRFDSLVGTPSSSPIHQQNVNNNNVINSSAPFLQRPGNLYTKSNHNQTQNMINNNVMTSQNFINNNTSTSSKMVAASLGNKNSNQCDNSSKGINCEDDEDEDDTNSNLIKLKAINSNFQSQFNTTNSPSSEEDNSPTEMNNCRRIIDKPPLVKRLTMGLLLKSAEDSRPLVYNTTNSSSNLLNNNNYNNNSKGSSHTICDGYVNEGICDPERIISSKFGDSCRQSLMSVHQVDNGRSIEHQEFNFKKNFLRETSSANSSPKIFHNSLRSSEYLSFQEQQELKGAAWFQAGIPREISLEVLSKQNPGAFLVRQSSSKPGCFALSLRVPPPSPKVAHYLILKTPRGYKIKGFTKEFTSLRALITHHSVMPELLPIPLSLPRPNMAPMRREMDDIETYGSLNDFRKMMADLNV